MVVPPGYQAFFEAGCEIDFIRGGFFISKSPVMMMGETDDPVVIRSSDNTAMGFTVLQADDLSRLENVVFDGLNTLNYDNWILTGAVNFYESNVQVEAVEFRSNVCEDALNIKGVSSGEGSKLSVRNTSVNGAVIGFASKDNSVLKLDACTAANVQYALAAYQKKPEYGPGNIDAKGFKAERINDLYIIEKFSTLMLNGTVVTGQSTKVADLFY